MEHPYYQPTLSVAEGTHQQQELSLFHPEQPSRSAQHTPHLHDHTSDNGLAQLNSFGEHSTPVITSNLQSCPPGLPPAVLQNSRERKRARDWEEAETSALLERVNLPRFRYQKRNQDYMKWDAIAKEIQKAVGSHPAVITGKRCKERMKTLRGCYEKVRRGEKEAGVTEEKWRKSKGLAVDWWYTAVGEFCGPRKGRLMDRVPERKKYATRFNSLNKLQMFTLLDLHFLAEYDYLADFEGWPLSRICECLSIVQNRSCLPIYEDVIALKKMGCLRRVSDDGEGEGSDDDEEITSESDLYISGLRTHEKFFKKAVDRNPAYDTRRTIRDHAMVTFDATRAPSGVTMLVLYDCEKLEVVDLSGFRELRFLLIQGCSKLREMIGCECPEELGWLEIWDCPSYQGYPPLQKMPSLQEFRFYCDPWDHSERGLPGGELDVSGCVRLRALEIGYDLALSSIRGLEGLRSLIRLNIWECKALRILPDIGHMKGLTHLLIRGMPVEEIKGVEKLSSLKRLNCWLSNLKVLPDLSHLPHLKSVDLWRCPVVDDPSSPYYEQPYRKFKCESKHLDVSDSE